MELGLRRKLAAFLCVSMSASFISCGDIVEKAADSPTSSAVTSEAVSEVSENAEASAQTTAPAVTTSAVSTTTAADVKKGILYDADGDVLVSGDVNEENEEIRVLNPDYKIPMANLVSEMSEGLDMTFEKKLRTPNPSPVSGDEKVGQSLQLTLDADKQNAVYQYMADMNIVGAAVVMRSDGSIMAEVSYPSYNPDDYYKVKHNEDLAWGTYGNKAFQNAEPGSVFKIMSEVISDKHGIYSLYDDGTWYYDDTSIVNWDHDTNFSYPIPDRSLYSAFINSSNIYFAKAFDQIGAEAVLADLNDIFHFGTDIDCDFGNLHNNVEIYCQDDLRRTAFGQSYVLTSPMYLAALTREAVFGDMVRPFVLKNVVDTNDFGTVIEEGSKPNDVIASIPTNCREGLLNCMSGVGANIGIYAPEGYNFYAKTGTAETWMGDFLYITGCMKNVNDNGTAVYGDYSDYAGQGSYIVVIQIRNGGDHGFEFASESAQVYQGIVNAVMN